MMNRLSFYSFFFLALCLSVWGVSWYALTTLSNKIRTMDQELAFFLEQEKHYLKTAPQRASDAYRFEQFPATLEKFGELAIQHRQIVGRKQAVADGSFQKYLEKILDSVKEKEKRIILLQQITKQLNKEVQRLPPKH
ncbi:hypothetical protein [Akkermansia sp.]|uniref:hypothetical protein n=1 Tax=Akkermansia sp. TaxID=1872421 RepID=UPI0025C3EA92|nr:hypothetical protein [Akkermansia sp.]MCC8149544.1 hypothetical protein [Akkermansia sp.]